MHRSAYELDERNETEKDGRTDGRASEKNARIGGREKKRANEAARTIRIRI